MMRKIKGAILGFVVLSLSAISCNKDFNAIDASGIVGDQNFQVRDTTFPVFAYNKRLQTVRTNLLPLYQLGNFDDPIYGSSSAAIAAQMTLPTTFISDATRRFGNKTAEQELEDQAILDSGVDTLLVGNEAETITKVYLDLPYFNNSIDSDNDGVPDILEEMEGIDPDDFDGDGVTNSDERSNGTDPLSPDTDGDGITDDEDDCIAQDADLIARRIAIDSVYGNTAMPYTLKVNRFNFFLRDFDPDTNFEESQEYFSNALESSFQGFIGDSYFDDQQTISDLEVLVTQEAPEDQVDSCPDDNMDPPSVIVTERLSPRIRVELNPSDFQTEIFDMEGADFLENSQDFANAFRGLFISTGATDDVLMLLDMAQAQVVIEYTFNDIITTSDNDTPDDTSDDTQEPGVTEATITFPLDGNIVNTLTYDNFPDNLIAGEGVNAENLYLKGGAGAYAEIVLFDEDQDSPEIQDGIEATQWLINEANLVFHLNQDEINSFGGNFENAYRIYIYDTSTELPVVDNFFDPTSGLLPQDNKIIHGGLLEEDEDGARYKIRITQHVNNIIRDTFSNVRLGVVVTPDINLNINYNAMVGQTLNDAVEEDIPVANIVNPFGTVLYGSAETVPLEKRLQLQIIYSDPNQ